jgi:nucleotide-binding universal stress UspA family protein
MIPQPSAIKSILFPLASYPSATTSAAVDKVITLASRLDAHLSAVAFEMDVPLPAGVYADIYSLGDIVAAEYQRGSANAYALANEFQAAAKLRGISHDFRLEQCVPADIAERAMALSHLHDLSIVAVKKENGGQRDIIEALLFGAGRPMLLLPEASAEDLPSQFERVAIAWDNRGPAARAIADSLPFLCTARSVHLLIIENEGGKASGKPSPLDQSARDMVRYLARHHVDAAVVNLDARGDEAGDVLVDHALKDKIELLVMGAYGHARLKEVVLGGTTDTILREPPCYVLMSR